MLLPHEMIANIVGFMPDEDKLNFVCNITNARQLNLYRSILPDMKYVIKHNWRIAKRFNIKPVDCPLFVAVKTGDIDCVRYVYDEISKYSTQCELIFDNNGRHDYYDHMTREFTNVLECAAERGYTECLKLLYRIAERDNIPYDNNVIACCAGRSGNIELLKYLWSIKNTFRIKFADKTQGSDMRFAAAKGHLDYIKYMVSLGMSADICTFHSAADHNQVKVLDYLYSLFPEMLEQHILLFATRDSNIDVLKWLTAVEYPISQSALQRAVMRNEPKCIEYLRALTLVD